MSSREMINKTIEHVRSKHDATISPLEAYFIIERLKALEIDPLKFQGLKPALQWDVIDKALKRGAEVITLILIDIFDGIAGRAFEKLNDAYLTEAVIEQLKLYDPSEKNKEIKKCLVSHAPQNTMTRIEELILTGHPVTFALAQELYETIRHYRVMEWAHELNAVDITCRYLLVSLEVAEKYLAQRRREAGLEVEVE